MKISIDWDSDPNLNEYAIQNIVDEETGADIHWKDLKGKIFVDAYDDSNGRLVFILTDHTFEDKSECKK